MAPAERALGSQVVGYEREWADAHTEAFAALAASGRYPTFAKVLQDLEAGYDLDLDDILEQGLAQLLDGMGEWIRRAKQAQWSR
ncbi:MAG TPA: TetR/AcrR family transcriptional regulator C-terminal domain-containing protein [Polyangiales bacterium]|nr:TetR/AcrR family transcriptional regulator C-terminal domain-containing protein [Polyangiales bacterium]